MFCFFPQRSDNILIQRKHISPCPSDVRHSLSVVPAARHFRNGRTVHDSCEYLRLVADGQGTASVVSHFAMRYPGRRKLWLLSQVKDGMLIVC